MESVFYITYNPQLKVFLRKNGNYLGIKNMIFTFH